MNNSNMADQAIQHGAMTLQTKITYGASASGFVVAGLTINEIIGITAAILSIIIAGFTAWSNHKRNKLQMEVLRQELEDKKKRRHDDA